MKQNQLDKHDLKTLKAKSYTKSINAIGFLLVCCTTIFAFTFVKPAPIQPVNTEVETVIGQYWIA